MLSIVVPVYKNEANLPRLLRELDRVASEAPAPVEVVFVVDGSPDRSLDILRGQLSERTFSSRLVALSRNFGAFRAIHAGLEVASGDYLTVMAADLQEPPELALRFLDALSKGEADIVFGVRAGRSDPWLDEMASKMFWSAYRRLVLPDLPDGGVDVFGCSRTVRDHLLRLPESNANLIALLFWLGFRRAYIAYERQPRLEGQSAWTLSKKLRYGLDSVFNFTDLPIRLLLTVGTLGMLVAVAVTPILVVGRLAGWIDVPGYTPIVLSVAFFGSIASLGLGIMGQYLWLVLQNVRRRPAHVVESIQDYPRG